MQKNKFSDDRANFTFGCIAHVEVGLQEFSEDVPYGLFSGCVTAEV